MQAYSPYDIATELVEHLVQRVVFVAPTHCIFETSTKLKADKAAELLHDFSAHVVTKNNQFFISVPLH